MLVVREERGYLHIRYASKRNDLGQQVFVLFVANSFFIVFQFFFVLSIILIPLSLSLLLIFVPLSW